MTTSAKSDGATQIVDWMVDKLADEGCLYQQDVIAELERRDLRDLITENSEGTEGIAKSVLSAFRKRTPDVVWSRSDLLWRPRVSTDAPGRMQD